MLIVIKLRLYWTNTNGQIFEVRNITIRCELRTRVGNM